MCVCVCEINGQGSVILTAGITNPKRDPRGLKDLTQGHKIRLNTRAIKVDLIPFLAKQHRNYKTKLHICTPVYSSCLEYTQCTQVNKH